jgi:methylenetetrahydrofolate--tRNA-(uracil-5-)-methyltransferase
LENAKFLRYGQIHRNTYINAPTLLSALMNMKQHANVFFAGQISGVEGYTESIAMGMLVGMHIARIAQGLKGIAPPRETALGSLVNYLTRADVKSFQPANITFDLLPQLDEVTRKKVRDKKVRHKMVCDQALKATETWLGENAAPLPGTLLKK